MNTKIFIIESNIWYAKNITKMLEMYGYQVVGVRDNATEAFQVLKENPQIELVLMDILINGEENGIDLAKLIRKNFELPIVYNTRLSDDDSFNKAYETRPDGYIIKPFSIENLDVTIKLALKNFQQKFQETAKSNVRIPVRDKGCLVLLEPKDIILAKADGLYTKIVTPKKPYIARGILKSFEAKLVENGFIRVHKSYLINVNFIESFNSKKLLINNDYIPIRRGLYNILKEILHNQTTIFQH